MKIIIAVILLVCMVGCANSGFHIQPIEDAPSVFVGLASSPDNSPEVATPYDHPVEWTISDLQSILKRLVIQEGSGLMDFSRPQQAVFSPENLSHLIPALQHTFKMASSSDWIAFAVWGGSDKTQGLQVTSGGLFLQDRRLHILIANHRERVSSEENGIHAIRKNPFHVLREVRRSLLFYPSAHVIETGNNWLLSGFGSPISEIILDYQALLAMNPHDISIETKDPPLSGIRKTDRRTLPTQDSELGTLQEEVSTLKDELSRLKQQRKQQAEYPTQTKTP